MLKLSVINSALNLIGLNPLNSLEGLESYPMLNEKGNTVANHIIHVVEGDGWVIRILQSYNTIVAIKARTHRILDTRAFDYSQTTSKYLKQFLGTTAPTKILRDRMTDGTYFVAELN